jgi:hypothetical protein
MRSKFGNRKVVTSDGTTFDSRGEYLRWIFLQEAQQRGEISRLRRQVTYEVVPPVHYAETLHLKTKDKEVQRTWTRAVTYTADFVYELNGKTVVEDFKGMPNDRWPIKKALMAFVHGIFVREVKKYNEPILKQF